MEIKVLPKQLVKFLTDSVILEQMCLPNHYPEANLQSFLNFQDGYRVNVNTGEYLISDNDGDWAPDCYVIAQNYFADPFVIFMHEYELDYPVYYAVHGAGRWDFEQVSASLACFRQELLLFQSLQMEPQKFAEFIATSKHLSGLLWKELYSSLIETTSEDMDVSEETIQEPWIYGKLLLTEIGVNKLQVVSFLKQNFKITGTEALRLVNTLPIELGCGVEKFMQPCRDYLERIGAKVIFVED